MLSAELLTPEARGPFIKSWAFVGLTVAGSVAAGLWLVPYQGVGSIFWVLSITAVVVLVVRPEIGFYLLVFTLPIQNLFVLEQGVTWTRLIAILVFMTWTLNKLLHRDSWTGILSANILRPGGAFVVFAVASFLWARHPSSTEDAIPSVVLLLALTALTVGIANSWRRLEWTVRFVVLGGIAASLLTISQFFSEGAARAGDDVTGGVNETGVQLVVLIPLAFYLLRGRGALVWRLMALSFLVMSVLAVAVTFSRTSFLLLPIVMMPQIWLMLKGRPMEVLRVLLVVVVGVVVLSATIPWERVLERGGTIAPAVGSDPNDSGVLSGRVQLWLGAMAIFSDFPLIGVGYGNFGYQYLTHQFSVPSQYIKKYRTINDELVSAHSSLLGMLAELGMLGILFWILLHGVAFQNLRLSWSKLSNVGQAHRTALVQAVAFSLVAYIMYSGVAVVHDHKFYWVILGLTEVLRQLAQRGDQDPIAEGPAIRRPVEIEGWSGAHGPRAA